MILKFTAVPHMCVCVCVCVCVFEIAHIVYCHADKYIVVVE